MERRLPLKIYNLGNTLMNSLDTLMMIACSIVWISMTMVFRIYTLHGYLLALWGLLFLCYMFIVFYSPSKTNMDSSVLTAKQEYYDNKDKLDDFYVNQLKQNWTNDMVKRNRCYHFMFMGLCYLTIPYYMICLLYPSTNSFALENSVPIAFGSVAFTSMVSILLWSGYTIGFLQLTYVIAGIAFTIIGFLLVFKLKRILPMILFAIWMIALFLWGASRVGIIPLVYILVSLFVLGFMIFSIIS